MLFMGNFTFNYIKAVLKRENEKKTGDGQQGFPFYRTVKGQPQRKMIYRMSKVSKNG